MKLPIVTMTVISSLFCITCKREKNTVSIQDIKGTVMNNCNDSGLANVIVYLNVDNSKTSHLYQVLSDKDGHFIFKNVSVYNNTKYTYSVYVPSKSGGLSSNPALTEVGITGEIIDFTYQEAATDFILHVTPKYQYFTIYCNKVPVSSIADSVSFRCYNFNFHKNVTDLPYSWGGGGYGNGSYTNNSGIYPMGKYHIYIETWVNSVHSYRQDSIYLNQGAQVSYTLNW